MTFLGFRRAPFFEHRRSCKRLLAHACRFVPFALKLCNCRVAISFGSISTDRRSCQTSIGLYKNLLSFQTPADAISILRGWIAADVKIRGTRFKFVNTHLETPIPGEFFEATAYLQLQQAMELVDALNDTGLPIILAGDFNSDAEAAGIGPDQYFHKSALFIVGAPAPSRKAFPK